MSKENYYSTPNTSSQNSPTASSASSSSTPIIDSIMVLLEPLMLCSGGVTYTMRSFLNEISQHIPELKLSIHENLLKILSQILTGKPLYQIIQGVSMSASHLIKSNNVYSLMSSSAEQRATSQPAQQQQNQMLQIEKPPPQTDIDSLVQALQTLRAFEFSSIYTIAFLRYCVDFYLQNESRLVKIEAVITTSSLLSRLISALGNLRSFFFSIIKFEELKIKLDIYRLLLGFAGFWV